MISSERLAVSFATLSIEIPPNSVVSGRNLYRSNTHKLVGSRLAND